jgi:hypothetical protein
MFPSTGKTTSDREANPVDPTPLLSRLERPDNWVAGKMKMFGGMLIF